MNAVCQICGSNQWVDLPDPIDGRCITTTGRIINEPLGKAHCADCGFVERVHAQFLGDTNYYEQDYANYYERPGAAPFHVARYSQLAKWMASVLGPQSPTRILDVGCGQGWAMEAMKAFYPEASIEGLEPSEYNSRVARTKGFVVYEARAGEPTLPDTRYDLVYSNNVIQHVTNARKFTAQLKEMVRDDGTVLITCPDGSVPNIEILWGDQNFSFLPAHLVRICREAGFETVKWFSSPPSPSVPPAQMVMLSPRRETKEVRDGMEVPEPNTRDVYRAKSEYLTSFRDIDEYLSSRTQGFARVFNFGASYWSSILAAYCPRYWTRVSACLVDNADNLEQDFLDKDVLELSGITLSDAVVVLGTSPSTHKALEEKFSATWKHVVAWNQFPPRY